MALIQLDTRLGWLNSSLISFNQLSVGTSKLEFEITENNQPKDLTDLRVMIEIKTPSGSVQEEHVTIIDAVKGKIEKDLSAPMLTEEGSNYGELSLYSQDNTKLLCTPKFRYIVGSNYGEQVVKQTSQYATLQTCIMEVKDLEKEVGNNIEEIEISKNLAEQAKNEAEQSKVESMQSASNSIQSSIAAERSAESALETSGTLDQVVEMAKQSAEASKQSASASQASADAAERAKDVALQSVEQSNAASKTANQASVNAEQALRDAIVSKDTAKQAETSATTSANEASKAEASANNSKAILEQKIQEIVAVKEVVDNTVSTANTAVEQANIAINAAETLTAENKNLILTAVQTTNRAEDAIANANTANQTANQKLIDTTEQANIATEQVQLAKDEVTKAQAETTKATEQANVAILKSEEATTQANRAAEEANKAGAQAQEKVNNKIGYNGIFDDTNFNFIKNKVVQDGLVYQATNLSTQSSGSTLYVPTNDNVFTIDIRFSGAGITLKDNIFPFVTTSTNSYFALKPDGRCFYFKYTQDGNDDLNFTDNLVDTLYGITNIVIIIDKVKCNISIYGNGKLMGIKKFTKNIFSYVAIGSPTSGYFSNLTAHSISIYNHSLTPAEIQHNFSVLNNESSIKELHTTDSTGKTSILKWATDSTHVEMSSGRTLEEEYMSVLKTMGKEFTSADGSPIQVDNGIEARIINAEVKGQTLKNILPTEIIQTLQGDGVSWKPNRILLTSVPQLKPNTQYTYAIEVYENTLTKDAIGGTYGSPYAFTSDVVIPKGKIGIITGLTTTISDLSQSNNGVAVQTTLYNTETGSVKFRRMLFEGDVRNQIANYIPFGLSSTQAIISNNGQQYPIYEPTIQGKTRILDTDTGLVPTDPLLPPLKDGDVLDLATKTITFANKSTQVLTDEQVKAYSKYKKVISLGGVGDVRDSLEVKEDGSGVIITNTKMDLFNGDEDWEFNLDNGTCIEFFLRFNIASLSSVLSDIFYSETQKVIDREYARVGTYLVVSILKSKLTTPDVDGFKQWLQANPVTVLYQLNTPQVTSIDKSITPTILTHKTNIIDVGSAVKAQSFKVTVPVDAIGELRAEINEIKKQLGAVAALQLGQIN